MARPTSCHNVHVRCCGTSQNVMAYAIVPTTIIGHTHTLPSAHIHVEGPGCAATATVGRCGTCNAVSTTSRTRGLPLLLSTYNSTLRRPPWGEGGLAAARQLSAQRGSHNQPLLRTKRGTSGYEPNRTRQCVRKTDGGGRRVPNAAHNGHSPVARMNEAT